MSHFAKVTDGKVTQVIVAEKEFFDTYVDSTPGEWIQTSYNTQGGKHLLGGTPLRGNYAGIGYTFNAELDAFVPPKPFASWVLNNTTADWEAPVPMPVEEGKTFTWNEETVSWVEVVPPAPAEAPAE